MDCSNFVLSTKGHNMSERSGWAERDFRSPAWVKVQLTSTTSSAEGLITNISAQGCRIRTGLPLSPKQCVRIRVPGLGSVGACTRWSKPPYAGLVFLSESDIWEGSGELELLPVGGATKKNRPVTASSIGKAA